MKNFHKFLEKNSPAYARWHKHPDRSRYHFMVFVVIVTILFVSLLVGIEKDINVSLNTSDASNSNGKANQQLTGLTTALLQASKRYQMTPNEGLSTALGQLNAAVASRQQLVQRLMVEDPTQVVMQAIPTNISNQLPDEIQSLLEQQVEKTGTLTALHADYTAGTPRFTKSESRYILTVLEEDGEQRYNLHFGKGEPDAITGAKVKVKGVKLNQEIAVEAANGNTFEVTSSPATSAFGGDRKTLVLLVNFTDNASQPFSTADASNWVFNNPDSTNAYYSESSFGGMSVSGQAVGWYTINASAGTCDYYGYASAADAAASRAGVSVSGYSHKVYIFPAASCGWSGLGQVGGSMTWIAYAHPYVITHELGHNFGMRHAASMSCGSQQIATSCSYSEYGDPYDVMGASWINRHNGAPHKTNMAWGRTQSVSSSGIYTIYPTESSTSNPQYLKIERKNSGDYLYVEYRQPIGMDTNMSASMWEGVGLLLGKVGGPDSFRLDMSPDGDFNNSALNDGGVFTDSANGITVTQLSHTSSSATVQVSMSGAPCTPVAPTVNFNQGSIGVKAGETASYQLYIRNNDNSSCSSSSFALAASVPGGFSANFNSSTVDLGPGQNTTVNLNVVAPIGTPDGAYNVVAQVNQPGTIHYNSDSGILNVFTPVPDSVSPTVQITTPSNGSRITAVNQNVSASATDNVKVTRVEFILDGSVLTADSAAPYTYKWNTKKMTNGTHTLTAKAYDAAGNVGTHSITITK